MPDPDAEEQRRAARKKGASKRLSGIIDMPDTKPVRGDEPYMPVSFSEPMSSGFGDHGGTSGRAEVPSRMGFSNDAIAPIGGIRKERRDPPYEEKRYIDRRRPR